MSEPLMLDAEDELKPYIQKYGEDLKAIEPKDEAVIEKIQEQKLNFSLVWSSGKILELTIRSIISRQLLTEDNRMIQRTWKTREEIEQSILEVIKPMRLQMDDKLILLELKNLLGGGARPDGAPQANEF